MVKPFRMRKTYTIWSVNLFFKKNCTQKYKFRVFPRRWMQSYSGKHKCLTIHSFNDLCLHKERRKNLYISTLFSNNCIANLSILNSTFRIIMARLDLWDKTILIQMDNTPRKKPNGNSQCFDDLCRQSLLNYLTIDSWRQQIVKKILILSQIWLLYN